MRFVLLFVTTWLQTLWSRLRRGPLMPTWPLHFEAIVRTLRRDWESTDQWPIVRLRWDQDHRPYPRRALGRLQVREEPLAQCLAMRFAPKILQPGLVLYLHGGSFLYGSARATHADFIAQLALATGRVVLGLEYRLAPEHPYPAALHDALAAYVSLVSQGQVVIAGDSAGGNLALVLALSAWRKGLPKPAGLALSSPWVDLTMPGASYMTNAAFDYGTQGTLQRHARLYAGTASLDDPQISPAKAPLDGLPSTFVIVGGAEILRDDIVAFANRAKAASVPIELHLAPQMPHNPPLFAGYHPQGQMAFDAMAHFIRERCRGLPR